MKSLIAIIIALVVTGSVTIVVAEDNYLLLRYEFGETETGDPYNGTYNVISNDSSEQVSLNCKVATVGSKYKVISPSVYYKFNNGWQIGGEYFSDSLGNERVGPSARYIGLIGKKVFAFVAGTYYPETTDHDVFVSLSTPGLGLYFATEVWHYSLMNGEVDNLHFRPLKVGYRFKNGVAPFVMMQKKWSDLEAMRSVSGLLGVEVRF